MTRCRRCNDPMELRSAKQTHCLRCAVEVASLIAADASRRSRFPFAKDLTR